jgi:hypothetical protein
MINAGRRHIEKALPCCSAAQPPSYSGATVGLGPTDSELLELERLAGRGANCGPQLWAMRRVLLRTSPMVAPCACLSAALRRLATGAR